MRELIEEIKGSRTHQVVLGTVVVLTILAAIWKYTDRPEHVTARQQAIEKATSGWKP